MKSIHVYTLIRLHLGDLLDVDFFPRHVALKVLAQLICFSLRSVTCCTFQPSDICSLSMKDVVFLIG